MPLIIDPALQAAVIRQFNLRGELAPFNLTENVVPVFDIGRITGATPTVVTTLADTQGVRVGTIGAINYLPVEGTRFDDGDVTNSGRTTNPMAGDVIVDSGAFPNSGTHRVDAWMANDAALSLFEVQWRNAANSATLATWGIIIGTGQATFNWGPFILNMALNERIRIVSVAAITGNTNATVQFNNIANSAADV